MDIVVEFEYDVPFEGDADGPDSDGYRGAGARPDYGEPEHQVYYRSQIHVYDLYALEGEIDASQADENENIRYKTSFQIFAQHAAN